jgi:hypothetical protein
MNEWGFGAVNSALGSRDMITNLYLLFEATEAAEATLAPVLQQLVIPGYSLWSDSLKWDIKVPGEPDVPGVCFFYAQNYFRIFISDLVIKFDRGSLLPPELANGENYLQSTVLGMPQFRLRRWMITEEGWDDADNFYTHILNEGNSKESFHAEQARSSL